METRLVTMVGKILSEMGTAGMADTTIKNYRCLFNAILDYTLAHGGEGYYSQSVIEEYLESKRQLMDDGMISKRYFNAFRKAAITLEDYASNGFWKWRRIKPSSKYELQSPVFKTTVLREKDNYSEASPLSETSVGWHFNVSRKFCKFLETQGRSDFAGISITEIEGFLNFSHSTNKRTMGLVIHHLKGFLSFLENEGLVKIDVDISLLKPQTFGRRNVVTFTKQEIARILEAIDRTSVIGKRDYAVILLGITTGLRKSDISELCLEDILWKEYSLSLIQRKTGKEIKLPLFPNTGNAIADYILNGRPKTGIRQVFLTSTSPVRPFGKKTADSIIKRYCKETGISKNSRCTIHSLRRSICTWMAEESIPVTIIAQCAGHRNLRSADRYIFADPAMACCCLDFTGIAPMGWEASL